MPNTKLTPDQALDRLKKGNEDFVADRSIETATGRERRLELAAGQEPFAILVGCSDSRVPPELLFGAGLGELFIVRNAGNSVDALALGSIEFAVQVLGAPLIVVLGHQRCGAVQAAVDTVCNGTRFPGSMGRMIEPIIPAVEKARSLGPRDEANLLAEATRENICRIVDRLRNSEPLIMEPISQGRLKVVGAEYNLENGEVEFFLED